MEHPNAELLRRMMTAFQSGDVDSITAVLAPGVRWHEAGNPEVAEGRDAVLQRLGGMAGVTADIEVHDVLATDEHAVALIQVALRKPDGGGVTYPAIEVAHVRDGLVTERWAFLDATPAEVTAFFAGLG